MHWAHSNPDSDIGLGWTEFCISFPWGIAGVLLANQLYEHSTWRWIYYIAVTYSGVVIIGTATFYFPPSRPRGDYDTTRWQEFKGLDFVGLFLFTTGITLFLVGLAYLKPAYSERLVISAIVVGGLALIGAFFYDFLIPKVPIFPLHLFAVFREFTIHLVILFIAGMIWQTVTTWAPQATLFLLTHDSVQLGLIQMPNNWSGILGGWIIPSFAHKIKYIRYQIMFALILHVHSLLCYCSSQPHVGVERFPAFWSMLLHLGNNPNLFILGPVCPTERPRGFRWFDRHLSQ